MSEKSINLLLVEDNSAEALLIIETLKEAGRGKIEAAHVESLKKAQEHISQYPVDVILLDLSLPDSYGLDTVIEIQRTVPALPVLVLTGNEDESMAMKAVSMGAEDYLFKGDLHGPLLLRSIQYAIQRKKNETEREKLIRDLQDALAEVKRLSGLLPNCDSCNKIRYDKGYWQQIERYMAEHAEVRFSHGICPDCARQLYPDLFNEKEK
ncbi:MAG: response regulator [Deltaproteobacteria bacterium]